MTLRTLPQPASTEPPSRADEFVRGVSEMIGGPIGEHAVKRSTRRWYRPVARIVLTLVCFTLVAHWVQKSPCQDGAWSDLKQYRQMCYTDVLALYYAEGLSDGRVPYRDHAVEYPVLTGILMGALGLPVHALGKDDPNINQGEWFYNLNALVLGAIAVASVAAMLAMRQRRPWDVAMFALAPALFVTATVNWDLLAVGFAVFGLYAWVRRRPALAGVLLGLGTAAKLWPGFLFIPLLLLGLRTRRFLPTFIAACFGIGTWSLVNQPIMQAYPASWREFFRLNETRAIDWGTLWYLGDHFPFIGALPGAGWFDTHISVLNTVTRVTFVMCCLGIAFLVFAAPRPPRLAQLAFLVVAAFLIFSKVWSQQYVLWLLPLAVLARPRWGAFLAWQGAEVLYFCAFYGELLGASGKPIFPESVFDLAALIRLTSVVVLCAYVVRDILRPELDVVRTSYDGEDPDGGLLNDDPAAEWPPAQQSPALALS